MNKVRYFSHTVIVQTRRTSMCGISIVILFVYLDIFYRASLYIKFVLYIVYLLKMLIAVMYVSFMHNHINIFDVR